MDDMLIHNVLMAVNYYIKKNILCASIPAQKQNKTKIITTQKSQVVTL